MNPKYYYPLCIILLLSLLPCPPLLAQSCHDDAPVTFTVVSNPGNPGTCFLQINWQDNMPAIDCGSPGLPAAGSSVPSNRDLIDLSTSFGGNSYALYDRGSGSSCSGFSSDIEYGSEANSYITISSNSDFCLADAESDITVEGNQTGANAFDCASVENTNAPAPVELAYFKAQAMDHYNMLEWATDEEINVASFVVERSKNGTYGFETVDVHQAAGNTNSRLSYQLKDYEPLPVSYYRLRSIDFDGSQMVSELIVVQRGVGFDEASFKVFPIPLKKEDPTIQVYYHSASDENISLEIADLNGRVIHKERRQLDKGMHYLTVDVPQAITTALIFRLHDSNGVQTRLIPQLYQD